MDIERVITEYMLVGNYRPAFFSQLNALQKIKRGTLSEGEIEYVADAVSHSMKYSVKKDEAFLQVIRERQKAVKAVTSVDRLL